MGIKTHLLNYRIHICNCYSRIVKFKKKKVHMDRINLLKFLLLVFALPAQYFIANNWSNDSNEQNEALSK